MEEGMNAKITYKVSNIPYPWDEKRKKAGDMIYALVKRTVPEYGYPTEEPVAVFNYDSEARQFAAHVFMAGLDGKLVEMDDDLRQLFNATKQLRESRGWTRD